jgi:DNA-binding XRE family transcriptional regulator
VLYNDKYQPNVYNRAVDKRTAKDVDMLATVKTGEKLKRYRRGAGLTQVELAEKAEVAQSTVTQIERGNITEPRPGTLKALAKVLGITPMDLLDDVED